MPSLIYRQGSGELLDSGNLAMIGVGYSGVGVGLNNPGMERVKFVGPIPCGEYDIMPAEDPVTHLGPLAFPLRPRAGTNTWGRDSFLLHADNAHQNHTASEGCIIQGPAARRVVATYVGCILTVVPGPRRAAPPVPAVPAPSPAPLSADALNGAELTSLETAP